MRTLIFLFMLPVFCLGQTYIEASGQTPPFLLAAGQTTLAERAAQPSSRALSLSISPNPSTGEIYFNTAGLSKGKVAVFTVSGRKTGEVLIRAGRFAPFNRVLPNGLYLARLESEGKILLTKRFLVVR
jgi:hypothetical protein